MSSKTLFASLVLAFASLAAIPSASAADLDPACVPPTGQHGVCVGTIDGDRCVWSWLGPSFRSVCFDDENNDLVVCTASNNCLSVGSLIAQPDPVCVPPGTLNGVCVGFIGNDLCVWAWLGPSFTAVCLDIDGRDVLLCDNGGCTSILRLAVTS